jgi:spore coat protein U-like protein
MSIPGSFWSKQRMTKTAKLYTRRAVCGIAALSLFLPLTADAATATSTFLVTATIQATCTISAGALAFGTYTGVAATGVSTVAVTCTNTTSYNVGLNAGTASGATVTTRKMTGPASALLAYSLYSDTGRSVNWGQTIGTDTVTGTGSGSNQNLTVYGAVAAGQYLAPGSYSDSVIATITY